MANYYSNHSQSRFLANNSNSANSNPSADGAGATGSATGANSASRSRLTSSKHFSTTVSTSTSVERAARSKESPQNPSQSLTSNSNIHPLRNTWIFWFRQQRSPGNKALNYEEGIKKISSFSSVESFWSLWTHLSAPSALQPTTDYLVFHSGVQRPVWEDPLNHAGGKWIIRLKKGVADRIWEDLVLAVIGDQFHECRSSVETPGTKEGNEGENGDGNGDGRVGAGSEWPEICGCTISVRQNEDIVSLWNRVDGDIKVREKIRDTLRKILNLHPATVMEYKSNTDSMQDKSSFRNSAIDRTPYT
ncbi:hypothetical protein AX17_002701 [Amanita inopinata Kibby_2008]|nr:hypothetical protein AX17_002701 [Amanita inopinata Kibby_2008]